MLIVKEVVYQATITTTESTETYVSLTTTEFKTGWQIHQMSFKHESKKNDNELTKHFWQLKDQKKDSWKILSKAKPYSNLTKINVVTYVILRNTIFYINRKWKH